MAENKIPSQQELQEEIRQFLEQKYGARVTFPETDLGKPKDGDTTSQGIEGIQFDIKPQELEAYLNEYVVHQREAVEVLSTKICTHFHRMAYERTHPGVEKIVGNIKSNILLVGPTGVGKTYIIRLIAHKLGVPFVKGDATKFSETGYVGGDVDDLVRDLVREAKGDTTLAEYGIIYLDEVDKIASSGHLVGPDVSRTGVQRALLKLMEETEVELRVPHDIAAQMEAMMEAQRTGKLERKKVNTRNILFVMSGAFHGLEDIIRRRLRKGNMGFGHDEGGGRKPTSTDDIMAQAATEDLLEYGFESEFIGRLPVIAHLRDLSIDGLFDILKNPKNAVIQGKIRDFKAYDIKLSFDDEALRLMAEQAHSERTGARGLIRVCERALIPFEKALPSTDIKELTVHRAMVENPDRELRTLVFEHDIRGFQRDFLTRTGIVLQFSKEAQQALDEITSSRDTRAKEWLEKRFKNYEYGLKLAGLDQFSVTPKVLEDPDKFLDGLVKESYKKNK
jgi:ATP-dependent Clp protease ATP-binding subunit ClpX